MPDGEICRTSLNTFFSLGILAQYLQTSVMESKFLTPLPPAAIMQFMKKEAGWILFISYINSALSAKFHLQNLYYCWWCQRKGNIAWLIDCRWNSQHWQQKMIFDLSTENIQYKSHWEWINVFKTHQITLKSIFYL